MTNWITYHVASGGAFFTGIVGILLGVSLGLCRNRWVQHAASLVFVVGLTLVLVSGTPLPYWYYFLALCAAVVWRVTFRSERRSQRFRWTIAAVQAVIWIAAAAMEMPFHFTPRVTPTDSRTVVLFGDSVSAGMGGRDIETWPHIIARSRSVTLRDYSEMGATVSSALKKARAVTIPDGIVVLEIGGNDLLGSTTVRDFERDLELLLAHLVGPRRQVIMFELPLPPFRNGYGRVQRYLASKYAVTLVPKRVFMGVLSSADATLDSIHLSAYGHELMACTVWQLLEPAFQSNMSPGTEDSK